MEVFYSVAGLFNLKDIIINSKQIKHLRSVIRDGITGEKINDNIFTYTNLLPWIRDLAARKLPGCVPPRSIPLQSC